MIRFVFALFLFSAMMTTAHADDPKEVSVIDLCRDMSLIAKDIMTARQNREPISEVLPATSKQMQKWAAKHLRKMDLQTAEELSAPMVMAAYDVNAYPDGSTWREKRRDAIRDFENEAFEQCYEEWTSE